MTDEPDAETIVPSSGPDRDEMASDYLPEDRDWLAKTQLDLNDPHAVAGLYQLEKMFPELSGDDELQGMIDEFTQDFLKGRTSIQGASRDEYEGILKSMFGGNPEDGNAGQQLAAMLGADGDDE